MYIVFLNPQGNFDKSDSFWTEHPDFGGQLVYVKEIAIAMAKLGHKVDIITRRFTDEKFNVFNDKFDYYDNVENVRIVRLPCGGDDFLNKELLWEHLHEWTDNIVKFFMKEKQIPDFVTGHYGDGGLAAAMLKEKIQIPYSFTGHSLGAQKLDKFNPDLKSIYELDKKYRFAKRIKAERTAIRFADIIFVSTKQEQTEQYNHLLYKDITEHKQNSFSVCPPGANTETFTDKPQEYDKGYYEKFQEICERDISKDRLDLPYIILASRLDTKKNHLGLVRAYASDNDLQERANLAISLRGIENAFADYSFAKPDEIQILDRIMNVIKENDLQGKVTFISINSQKELASFYRFMANKKSVFTLTALYEPFGLAPIEAMSSGLPVAVTKYGGPSEVLKENDIEYGVLLDIINKEDIVKGLKRVFDNYEEFKKLGNKRVMEKYTWNATAKNYLKAIDKVLETDKRDFAVSIPRYFYGNKNISLDTDYLIKKYFEKDGE